MTATGFLAWLPSILVVGGWAIAYNLQAMQARRKVLREEVEKTRNVVESLHETALRFHMNLYSVPDHMKILGLITDIERRYAMFPQIAQARKSWLPHAVDPIKTKIAPKHLVRLRQSITMDHFDDPTAVGLPYGAPQLTDITKAATRMIAAIDQILIAALD